MELKDLGFCYYSEKYGLDHNLNNFITGRVIAEHKERYIVKTEKGEFDKTAYENYLKLEREKASYESSAADQRKKDKDFEKFLKNYKKNRNKYL